MMKQKLSMVLLLIFLLQSLLTACGPAGANAPAVSATGETTAAPAPAAEPIVLCESGESPYRIVISTSANQYEKNAAELVQKHFEARTGIRLPIVTDDEERIDTEIVVGNTKRDKYSGISVTRSVASDALISEENSYRLVASRQRIFLYCLGDKNRNSTNRGTVFAAYRFIEEALQYSVVYGRALSEIGDRVTVPGDLDVESSSHSLSGKHTVDYPGETVLYSLPQADTSTKTGASVILKTADGKIMVIDGGYAGDLASITEAVKALTPAGKSPTVDAWVITHLHDDHFNALLHYIDCVKKNKDVGGLTVKEIWSHILSDAWYEKNNLAEFVKRGNILKNPPAPMKYVDLAKDQIIPFGEAEIEVLYVGLENIRSNMNDTSVVLKVKANGRSMLLLADAEKTVSGMLMRKCTPEQLKADAVQIGHHGTFNVQKEVYEAVGAAYYFWPITYVMWHCDDGTGLGAINRQYGTYEAMAKTRQWLEELDVPEENLFLTFKGISVYRFATGTAEYVS